MTCCRLNKSHFLLLPPVSIKPFSQVFTELQSDTVGLSLPPKLGAFSFHNGFTYHPQYSHQLLFSVGHYISPGVSFLMHFISALFSDHHGPPQSSMSLLIVLIVGYLNSSSCSSPQRRQALVLISQLEGKNKTQIFLKAKPGTQAHTSSLQGH